MTTLEWKEASHAKLIELHALARAELEAVKRDYQDAMNCCADLAKIRADNAQLRATNARMAAYIFAITDADRKKVTPESLKIIIGEDSSLACVRKAIEELQLADCCNDGFPEDYNERVPQHVGKALAALKERFGS
jgi:hypothetical protein